jgi:hypothetical protein
MRRKTFISLLIVCHFFCFNSSYLSNITIDDDEFIDDDEIVYSQPPQEEPAKKVEAIDEVKNKSKPIFT